MNSYDLLICTIEDEFKRLPILKADSTTELEMMLDFEDHDGSPILKIGANEYIRESDLPSLKSFIHDATSNLKMLLSDDKNLLDALVSRLDADSLRIFNKEKTLLQLSGHPEDDYTALLIDAAISKYISQIVP